MTKPPRVRSRTGPSVVNCTWTTWVANLPQAGRPPRASRQRHADRTAPGNLRKSRGEFLHLVLAAIAQARETTESDQTARDPEVATLGDKEGTKVRPLRNIAKMIRKKVEAPGVEPDKPEIRKPKRGATLAGNPVISMWLPLPFRSGRCRFATSQAAGPRHGNGTAGTTRTGVEGRDNRLHVP